MDLKKESSESLVDYLIAKHNRQVSQGSKYFNSIGTNTEAVEKAAYDQLKSEIDLLKVEIIARMK